MRSWAGALATVVAAGIDPRTQVAAGRGTRMLRRAPYTRTLPPEMGACRCMGAWGFLACGSSQLVQLHKFPSPLRTALAYHCACVVVTAVMTHTCRCDCPRNRTGPACHQPLSRKALAERCRLLGTQDVNKCNSEANTCINGCHGPTRGACVAGFCHCRPGACQLLVPYARTSAGCCHSCCAHPHPTHPHLP